MTRSRRAALNNQPDTATGGDRPIDPVGAFFLLGAILALRRSHHQSGSGTGKS